MIGCSSLCLTLPGVNAITQVILPAIVPALFAILVSIPLIIYSVKKAREAAFIYDMMLDNMIALLEKYYIPERKRRIRLEFMMIHFLKWQKHPHNPKKFIRNTDWPREYQQKILTEMKKQLGEKKEDYNFRQKKIASAIDKAIPLLYQSRT